jgi:hypothetical protein
VLNRVCLIYRVVTKCDQLVVMPCVIKPIQVLKQSHRKCMGYEMLLLGGMHAS